jgi:hypothetical protein
METYGSTRILIQQPLDLWPVLGISSLVRGAVADEDTGARRDPIIELHRDTVPFPLPM